jgi:hypothetical protein
MRQIENNKFEVKKVVLIIFVGILISFLVNTFPIKSFFYKIFFLSIISLIMVKYFSYESLLYSTIFLIPYNLYLFDIIGQYTISYLQVLWVVIIFKFFRNWNSAWKDKIPSTTLVTLITLEFTDNFFNLRLLR